MSSGTLSPGTLSLGTIAYGSASYWLRARRPAHWSAYLRTWARNGCLSHLIEPGGRRTAYAVDAAACAVRRQGALPRHDPLRVVGDGEPDRQIAGGRQRAAHDQSDASTLRRSMTAIADSGAGIPGEQLNRVFDPFFTTTGNGPRMWPSIARTIVEAHGGRIRPEIRCRAGAVFRVAFPLAQPTAG